MNQVELQNLLRKELTLSQVKNPAYSIRAFAKKLGLGFGTLSQVLAGKRTLATKSTLKVLDRISANPLDRAKILNSKKLTPSYEYNLLQADQHFILSEWHYLAILNLLRTHDFVSTYEHIAGRLGISVALAKQAIERLERTQLIKTQNKKWVRTNLALSTTDQISSPAVRKSHAIHLELANAALETQTLDQRDFTWLTFAFDPNHMQAAKEKIREFQDEFSEQFSTSKEATEVYRMGIQLFGLTQPQKTKTEPKKRK